MSDQAVNITRDTPGTPDASARPASPRRQNERRGGIVAVLILSLLASAGARYWAGEQREAAIPRRGADSSGTSLSGMNSFALGLLLGGLRGPLVMILWIESETHKGDKNLEGVDTQIEWIRLLQPEFDTVHMFEIWNKAYNISVQMANRANKYDVILGALDYAHNVDRDKPDDINIITSIGQLYFDKYGNSSEKLYYRKRVRQETLPHPNFFKARSQNSGWRRVALDPILDSSFDILPQLYKPIQAPNPNPGVGEWNDGSELQYLPKYQPYPDGVSPFGLSYNYYKRAEVLQSLQGQRHAQLSDMVMDSRPALALKFWAEEEMEQGRRRELQAFDVSLKDNLEEDDLQKNLQGLTADFRVDHPLKDPNALKLAIAAYTHTLALIHDSLEEYVRHILKFPQQDQQCRSYMDEMRAENELASGDLLYLQAMLAQPADRPGMLVRATDHYKQSQTLNYQILLRYYIDATLLAQSLPPGYGLSHTTAHKGIEDLTHDQSSEAVQKADLLKRQSRNSYVDTNRYEFDRFIHRAIVREQVIAASAQP